MAEGSRSLSRQRERQLRKNDERCPHCNTSLQGDPIPRESQEAYGATHFGRQIALYSRERDRTEGWKCPDCNHEWPR